VAIGYAKSLAAFKQLHRGDPTLADADELENEIRGQSDRAAALISASILENRLEIVLTSLMRSLTQGEHNELFRGEGPLATFAKKTKLAYAFNVFGSATRRDLDIIREIRNAFAHSRIPFGFNTQELATLCGFLHSADLNLEANPPIEFPAAQRNDPKGRYIIACRVIGYHLAIRDVRAMTRTQRRRILP
jgi:hypothetical protein